MKGWIKQIRRFALVLCCTTLSFFHSQARAETAGNVVHTTAKAAADLPAGIPTDYDLILIIGNSTDN